MSASIPDKLGQLRTLRRQQLLELWQALYGRAAPLGMRRELLVPFLAYRIQENALGGLKPKVRTDLSRIIRTLEKKSSPRVLARPVLKVGTRLLRQWRGETHEVFVTDSGYEYRKTLYQSLSEIARKITGTRWSGPAFFGTKKSANRGSSRD